MSPSLLRVMTLNQLQETILAKLELSLGCEKLMGFIPSVISCKTNIGQMNHIPKKLQGCKDVEKNATHSYNCKSALPSYQLIIILSIL